VDGCERLIYWHCLGRTVARGLSWEFVTNPANRLQPSKAVDRFRGEAKDHLRWAFDLGLFTGQRLGDVIAMRWGDIQDGGIVVKQQKTRAELWVPIIPELQATLDIIPRRSLHILKSAQGKVWGADNFKLQFRNDTRRLGLGGFVFHGLRKTAAVMLAEAGCSTEQIKAITGHTTDGMVSYYVKGANQRKLAAEAMGKLRNGNRT